MEKFFAAVSTLVIAVSAPAAADVAPHSGTVHLTDTTYELTETGDKSDDREDVINAAILAAAEETIAMNYDWFRVVSTEVDRETVTVRSTDNSPRFERVPVRSCSLLGCSTEYQTQFNSHSDSFSRSKKSVSYTVNLEYQVGTGHPGSGEDVYNASIVTKMYN